MSDTYWSVASTRSERSNNAGCAASPRERRLEDVEKVVRKLAGELQEMFEWALDCQEALCSRIEELERRVR